MKKRFCFFQPEIRDREQTLNSSVKGGSFNPLSSHDALMHHITFLKTDLIFLELRGLEGKFR